MSDAPQKIPPNEPPASGRAVWRAEDEDGRTESAGVGDLELFVEVKEQREKRLHRWWEWAIQQRMPDGYYDDCAEGVSWNGMGEAKAMAEAVASVLRPEILPAEDPRQMVLLAVIDLLEATRHTFKSKQVERARQMLLGLVNP